MKTLFLSETIFSRALIFGIKHHLVELYQVCSNYAPGGHMFYTSLYRENLKKSSCLKAQGIERGSTVAQW